MGFLKSLSGRFLILTVLFVMLAEVLIFVPSIARYREDFLMDRLERAQIASLALLANDEISNELQEELLQNAGVFNVVLRRDEARQLMLSAPMPSPIVDTFDLRDAPPLELIGDAMTRLVRTEPEMIRVIGDPSQMGGLLIEVTLLTDDLRAAMVDYGLRILLLSAMISVVTAALLYFAVRGFLVRPIASVARNMTRYAEAPEDANRVITPRSTTTEIRQAEEALLSLQTQLTSSLRQRERLAQLGGAVAKVSHDLRNILTSAQLFTDRIEMSEDPAVKRMAPKLVNSIARAVHLCESTLAYGKAEEQPPTLGRFGLIDVVSDVIESERLAVGDADVSFAEDVPTGLVLRADHEQLYRVIANLVRNARQAIVNSGKPGEIAISGQETSEAWLIRVSDTGPGLPPKARDHLFQPFHGGATKGGTGLGLSIAAELIRGHGGTLELESTDETGTVFCVSLPRGGLNVD
ncbi:HAMP domain-containing sensor histidine kinase [Roseovarius sp. SK2]|uniref:sensor histidine kinase n=1 Tax=Roseovarius TaxID=74030 RepID=UPI00237A5940|nr:HAMP domain-containing sensor histidine kinase [Roseovarius sp. SK2]MDD9724017.1 HAMP domain-containing sensor histidine kinase [Roseovarius sp. SK2]